MDQPFYRLDGTPSPRSTAGGSKLPLGNCLMPPNRIAALSTVDLDRVLDIIDATTEAGRRDLALLGLTIHCLVRAGAIPSLKVHDYETHGGKRWLRLHAERPDSQLVPVHPVAAGYLDAYVLAANTVHGDDAPLFRPLAGPGGRVASLITGRDVLRTVRHRARAAGLTAGINTHTLRATGLALFLSEGGTWEEAKLQAGFHHDHQLARYADALATEMRTLPRSGTTTINSGNAQVEN
jgi:integrase